MGTVALVTGANRGIGREAVRQLADRGVLVVMGSRNMDHGAAAANDLAKDGILVTPVRLDVTDAASVEAAATEVERQHGRLDILVNNAGVIAEGAALEVTAAELRRTFEVNVVGAATCIRSFLPLLRCSSAARIVNVSSTTASLALTAGGAELPGDADRRLAYTTSKAALNMLTLQYARAFGRDPQLAHVKINSVTPGYTATAMNDFQGTRSVEMAARIIVELAMVSGDGPTGGFFADQGRVPW